MRLEWECSLGGPPVRGLVLDPLADYTLTTIYIFGRFGLMIILGLKVFNIFGLIVIFWGICSFIFLLFWICPIVPALFYMSMRKHGNGWNYWALFLLNSVYNPWGLAHRGIMEAKEVVKYNSNWYYIIYEWPHRFFQLSQK